MDFIFANQSPSTPFVVIGLLISGVFIAIIVVAIMAVHKLWQTRHLKNDGSRKTAIITLIVIGLIVLYECSGLIYDKLAG